MKSLNAAASEEMTACETDNSKIRSDFSEIYTGDLAGLLENAKTYRSKIEELQARLKLIDLKQEGLSAAIKNRSAISEMIDDEMSRQKNLIDERWRAVKDGHPDWTESQTALMRKILADRAISVRGHIRFDRSKFLSELKEVLNLRSFRAAGGKSQEERIFEEFPISDHHSFLLFMKSRIHEIEKESFVSGDISAIFYDVTRRSSYLRVEPEISYGGRPLDRLSVGQKGTVYLCLKLATQAFSQPLIFDQPEDDLDNEFIIDELVDIFRRIKEFRQVILVTHNANLVVNADAEQVIVADNRSGQLCYVPGSLESKETNAAVRRVLEGGDDAFRKRELRYNLGARERVRPGTRT